MSTENVHIENESITRVVELLGGGKVFRKKPSTHLDAHDLIVRGMPSGALLHLSGSVTSFRDQDALKGVLGVSLRTLQRRKEDPQPLSEEQGGRLWRFAEILAQAIRVFGSQEEAERWLCSRVPALSGRRPFDLLATPAGVELVETYLTQVEYGVYV